LSIGENVIMAPNVAILTLRHVTENLHVPICVQGHIGSKVIIEDDVWIGFRATILPGIRLGKGCIIGAGAVVTKNVPSYAVMGGVPAKIIRFRYNQ